jgi:Uma2 family endonuclease
MSAQIISSEKLYTEADLERFSAQGYRYELIRGELIEMLSAGFYHGIFTDRLSSRLSVYVQDNDLGEGATAETGFKIEQNPDTVLAPDWAFIAKERLPTVWPRKGFMPVVPDFVLETRSPEDTKKEVADKVQEWLNAGVRMVWTLDPLAHTLTVHRPRLESRTFGPEDTLSGEDVIPVFTYPLSKLFRVQE